MVVPGVSVLRSSGTSQIWLCWVPHVARWFRGKVITKVRNPTTLAVYPCGQGDHPDLRCLQLWHLCEHTLEVGIPLKAVNYDPGSL